MLTCSCGLVQTPPQDIGRVHSGARTCRPVFTMLHHFHAQHPVSGDATGLDPDAAHPGFIVPIFAQGCHVNSAKEAMSFPAYCPYFLRKGRCMRQHFAHYAPAHTAVCTRWGSNAIHSPSNQTHPAEKSIFQGPLCKTGLFMPSEAQQIQSALRYRTGLASSSSTESGFVR